eukprot:NODE_31_length_37178_cov_0.413576.p10 type:complete len:319 gc:universal NODE_31_length_37178_cov_0.413576:23889-22933(-)
MVQSTQQHYQNLMEIHGDDDKVNELYSDLANTLTIQEKFDILLVYGKKLRMRKPVDDVVITMESTNVPTNNVTKDVVKAIHITNSTHSNVVCISNRPLGVECVLQTDKEARQLLSNSFKGCCIFDYSDELDTNHILAILQNLPKLTDLIFLSSINLNMLPKQIKEELNLFENIPKVVLWNGAFLTENIKHYYILLSKNKKEKIFTKLIRKLSDKRIIVYTSPSSFSFKMNQLTGNAIESAYIGQGKSVFVEQFINDEKKILVTTEKHVVSGDFQVDLILNIDGTKEGTKSYMYRTGSFHQTKHLVLNMVTEEEFKLIK